MEKNANIQNFVFHTTLMMEKISHEEESLRNFNLLEPEFYPFYTSESNLNNLFPLKPICRGFLKVLDGKTPSGNTFFNRIPSIRIYYAIPKGAELSFKELSSMAGDVIEAMETVDWDTDVDGWNTVVGTYDYEDLDHDSFFTANNLNNELAEMSKFADYNDLSWHFIEVGLYDYHS